MAAALVEYCNQENGTKWSDLRRQHGIEKPHNVKYWCLGNEMDGPWQIGHMPAREYGLKARDCANQMRMVDPALQLIACGSSGPGMQTYLEWDRQMLEECYDMVDGISLHCYYRNDAQETGAAGDTSKFLSFNLADGRSDCGGRRSLRLRQGAQALAQEIVALLRRMECLVSRRAAATGNASGRRICWRKSITSRTRCWSAVSCNSLMRYADRVRVACLAQLVNVIAPITTNKDGFFRQTIYYPYAWALQCARGDVLDLAVESPTYDVRGHGSGALYRCCRHDWTAKAVTLFILNRDLDNARDVEIVWRESPPQKVAVLAGTDGHGSQSLQQLRRSEEGSARLL